MDGYPSPLASPPTTTPAAARPTSAAEESSAAPTATPDEQQRLLVLRFQVMAESDAHILLTAQRRSDREAYEVSGPAHDADPPRRPARGQRPRHAPARHHAAASRARAGPALHADVLVLQQNHPHCAVQSTSACLPLRTR
ncbi:hypothetical protein ONE63_000159 [Megalurothrips usitatus]|uniref:Uncharacterized protein n=1 Tax=Megalurothrips usitatus TaxID=439358 RepID=A0AAV7Y027_9NEOP|nr:hypothetical protein ONE63_000159 [Megalurothrips usitatus]